MSTAHLTSEELDLVMMGDGLAPDRAAHLASCLTCRRRRAALEEAIGAARIPDPAQAVLDRARAAALAASPQRRVRPRWWLAAAAVVLLAVLAAVFIVPALRPQPVDTDAILLGVDEVLARDPLAAMADESVVEVVVADTATAPASKS